jgi:Major Facilitator Superfamily
MLLRCGCASRATFRQRTLIRSGFAIALVGLALLILMVDPNSGTWSLAPGLFCLGTGIGVMLTASLSVVQSSVPEGDQGEISGVSRSASNLGSSMGVAIAGAVLVSGIIAEVTARMESSSVLSPDQKQQISAAVEGEVTALSDAQVRASLKGQPQDVVDEVARITNEARDEALGFALISIAVAGVLGLGASLLLSGAPRSSPTRRAKRRG